MWAPSIRKKSIVVLGQLLASVLGPVLYLLYSSGISILENNAIAEFADETVTLDDTIYT